MKKLLANKYFQFGLIALGGIFLGWLLFHSPHRTEKAQQISEQTAAPTVWTCAMHPQIRMDKPGKCPICGMDLIPLKTEGAASVYPDAIKLTKEAAELANVETSVVARQKPVKEVRLYGKVQADERLLQSQTAHMPGRIEKLQVNFTGETVRKGQPLAVIYSPDLITGQQELLEASKMKQVQPEIYEAAKEKLKQWKLTDDQIARIEVSGNATDNFEIYSNTDGVITARRVNNGDHVDQGTVLFEVANLSDVWVMFDAYESDLPFLNTGDRLAFTVQALPGTNFTGRITFIDPVIDPVTRVAKVRVEIGNGSGRLKPEMFATGIVKASLDQYANKMIIPRSAVLWTGVRSVVYVKQPGTGEPVFKMREIELGPSLGNSYVVLSGLNEGEEIVTNGAFSVDASAQLEGKPSMMNSQGGRVNSMPGMNMPEMEMPENQGTSGTPREIKPATESMEMAGIPQGSADIKPIVNAYVQMKNSLANDNPVGAAKAAESLKAAFNNLNVNKQGADLKKTFDDIKSDAVENAEHISESGKNIAHQREHFDLLSKDVYDLVKKFGTGQVLYKIFCPMYNNGKGAYWISETKEIQNPYMGKSMSTCGTVSEELKP